MGRLFFVMSKIIRDKTFFISGNSLIHLFTLFYGILKP